MCVLVLTDVGLPVVTDMGQGTPRRTMVDNEGQTDSAAVTGANQSSSEKRVVIIDVSQPVIRPQQPVLHPA